MTLTSRFSRAGVLEENNDSAAMKGITVTLFSRASSIMSCRALK
jgi:hypothetical protein